MVARTKVVPPVTPKIIQQHTRHRHLRLALLFGVFLLIVWFSYDLGRSQAPEWVIGDNGVVQPDDSAERIEALEEEKRGLQARVKTLEERLAQSDRALATAQSRIRSLQRAAATPGDATAVQPARVTSAPARESVPAAGQAALEQASAVDNTLQLANVEILPGDTDDVFRISFSVMHAGNGDGRVTGTLWIAVNGFTDKQPVRLSFKRLSADRRSYVKMGFDRQQDVMEEITLPDNFRPKNILIEAKPYGDKYTGTTAKVDWDF